LAAIALSDKEKDGSSLVSCSPLGSDGHLFEVTAVMMLLARERIAAAPIVAQKPTSLQQLRVSKDVCKVCGSIRA
jgi:hypothetical protein